MNIQKEARVIFVSNLIDKIIYAIKNKEIFEGMKLNCVEKAREYVPSKSLKVIIYGLLEE